MCIRDSANLVTWQYVAEQTGAILEYMYLDEHGHLKDGEINKIDEKTKIVAFAHVSNVLGMEFPVKELTEKAHSVGAIVVLDGAQSTPCLLYTSRQIAYNAGLEGSVVVEKVKNTEAGVGFNALTEEYIDMVKAGIVDPAKVTRSALQNAASIASLVLTTETIVADKVDENAAVPAMPPMGGMGGMM